MKQKFASENTTFAVLMGLLAVLLLVPSCTTDDKVPDLSDEGTNDWIYKVMTDYYLWNEDVPDKGDLNFSQSPDKFFGSLLSDQDGVKYGDGWLTFRKRKRIRSLLRQTIRMVLSLHRINTATFIMLGFCMSCLALLLPKPDWNGGTGLLLLVVRLRT